MSEEDDPIANALGRMMSERRQELDPRLERYAAGELSPAEQRELEARAEKDPIFAEQLAAFRPLTPAFHAALSTTVARELEPQATVTRLRWPVIGLVLAAAAAAIFFFMRPIDQGPVPKYKLVAKAGDAEWRSENAAAKNSVRADSLIELVFRPEEPVEREIDGALYVMKDGEKKRSDVRPEISSGGAIRFTGRADLLSGARTGTVTFILEVGERGGETWQNSSVEVVIRPVEPRP